MRMLKQSTAANIVVLMVDSSDRTTGQTGKTLTVKLMKDGGSFSTINPTVTDKGDGFYNLALTAAHTDTLGELVLNVTATGCDPAVRFCQVSGPSAADIAAAILAAAQITPIHADTKLMNGAAVIGDGTAGNDWRGVGVQPQ